LGTLLAGAIAVFLALLSEQARPLQIAILAFVAAFSLVVFLHRRVDRGARRFALSRRYHEAQRARLVLAWDGIPPSTASPPDRGHPFAADLYVTGPRSLHRLLDTAVSTGGSERLRDWLLGPVPDLDRLYERQALVRELRPRPGFRSRLALGGALVLAAGYERWDGEQLLRWLEENLTGKSLGRILAALAILAGFNTGLFLLALLGGAPAYWIISLTVYAAAYLWVYRDLSEVFSQAQHLSDTLDRFRAVLAFLENYPYEPESRLARLCAPFWQAGQRPSRYLRRIAWIASAASLQGNPVVWLLLNGLVPWDLFFAYQLQRYKAAMRGQLPAWLEAWYELEALNSLANFAYLNPHYTFPQVLREVDPEDGAVFAAQSLGHPLIPEAEKVRNDFRIESLGQVALITGSNMSGKTTFLRTLGANLCLAYAGAPVDSARLTTIPWRLFTCIEVSDSLSDGISYFYAEVRRLKDLLDALRSPHPMPLFFLIDEIFRGTNNRERQIGGRAYVRALAGGHGAGLISTHDLELVTLADALPQVGNYHFQETVLDGRMIFDYRLRPGPSPTTNALRIMEMEGLPVDPAAAPSR
ncbi:MAG TPA: hypothetical protein VGA03_04110, partial [Anaerolineales bacterium]